MQYPTSEQLLKRNGKVLLQVHRSFRSFLDMIALAIFTFIVIALLTYLIGETRLPIRWLGLIPAGILLEIGRRYYDQLWVIERDRINHYCGRLSLSYSVPAVRYTDIRAITIDQNIIGRILDYGNIQIGTAGTDGFEMIIKGVRSPEILADVLDELRTASIQATRAGVEGEDQISHRIGID